MSYVRTPKHAIVALYDDDRKNYYRNPSIGYNDDSKYDAIRDAKEKYYHNPSVGQNGDHKYNAFRDAEEKYYRNPEKYTAERSYYRNSSSGHYTRNKSYERVRVVIEHWSGCSGERRVENIKDALEDEFPDVKFTDFYGRYDSFEVFISGKLLYSRIMQGGYPYLDEVLDAVARARRGKEIFQIDRYGGSDVCSIL